MMNEIYDATLLLAGNCIFTAKSELTGMSFTYKITRDKEDKHRWSVRILAGDNKRNPRDWYYLAIIKQDWQNHVGYIPEYTVYHTKHSCCNSSDIKLKALNYIISQLPASPKHCTLYHEGRCARCGKRLTTPESIKIGLGDRCRRLM